METRQLVVRKYIDNLMFLTEESNEIFRLQSNTVYKLRSIQFSTSFKNEHDRKGNTHTSCLSTKLQITAKGVSLKQ